MVSIRINKTELIFNSVIYVDCVNGNDTNGNGTKSFPYATLTKANSSVIQDNTCIYLIHDGVYEITDFNSLLNLNYNVSYIVEQSLRGKVILNINSATNFGLKMNKLNSFYGFILRRPTGADTRVYAYFMDSATINLEFNNCVFDLINGYPTTYPIYTGNSSGSTITKLVYNNCSFLPNFANTNLGSGILKGNFINCAFVKSSFTSQLYNLNGVTFDSLYNIIGLTWENIGTGINPDNTVANIGVYGGEFGWGYETKLLYLIKQNNQYYTIKSEFYPVGQDTLTKEIVDKYGSDSLTNFTNTFSTNSALMTNGGVLGAGQQFSVDLNSEMLSLNDVIIE